MSYSKTNWEDGKTQLNAKNLNNLEAGVEQAHLSIDNTLNPGLVSLQTKVRSWGPVFNTENGHVIMTPIVQGFNVR